MPGKSYLGFTNKFAKFPYKLITGVNYKFSYVRPKWTGSVPGVDHKLTGGLSFILGKQPCHLFQCIMGQLIGLQFHLGAESRLGVLPKLLRTLECVCGAFRSAV